MSAIGIDCTGGEWLARIAIHIVERGAGFSSGETGDFQ